MTTIIWFEHMYQPAWNNNAYGTWDPQRMIQECYRPNAKLMKKLGVKINMNITQTMYDFFKENHALDVLEIYKELGAQIEYVGSTAHHILAIDQFARVLPAEIEQQHTFIEHYFGQSPTTFFPPEMAIDNTTETTAKNAGYKGLIVSGGKPNFATYETTGVFENQIKIFPHHNNLSGQFAFPVNGFSSDHDLQRVIDTVEQCTLPVLFAFDHESFGGYHNPNVLAMKKRFFETGKERGWNFVHFSDLLDSKSYGRVTLQPTTWVGSYGKWDKMPERSAVITKALASMTMHNQQYLRKWVLPSCHLHVDYATDLFWNYVRKAQIPALTVNAQD
ncbi:hypothetical protein GF342_03815 [Candidatus Woesearchaeota archaeon]|nr:hypothetical protein [Candidatus Woesearchaeota archaeon]